jgi:hypothetical protein
MTHRDPDIIGVAYADASPRLTGTEVVRHLDRVYATGEPFVEREYRAMLDPQSRFIR